jgi:hypothetical protein
VFDEQDGAMMAFATSICSLRIIKSLPISNKS